METRTITQVKVYALVLNQMMNNTESKNVVAISYEKEKLIDWYHSLRVNDYVENGTPSFECHGDSHDWHKSFQKGSELEWYNPCSPDFSVGTFGHGIHEYWINQYEDIYSLGYKVI